MEWKIYHNPHCSKSRAALAILEESVKPLVVVDYLKNPPSMATLRALAQKLGLRPKDFIRKGEEVFKALSLDLENDEEMLKALHEHPILIERPIVETAGSAMVGRPAEKVSAFIQQHNSN